MFKKVATGGMSELGQRALAANQGAQTVAVGHLPLLFEKVGGDFIFRLFSCSRSQRFGPRRWTPDFTTLD